MNDQATKLRELVRDAGGTRREVLTEPKGNRSSGAMVRPATSREHSGTSQDHFAPRAVESIHPESARFARAIAICSGKGGVGKTNVAVNLCVHLARQKRRVCLIDADLGLANADVLCNLTPRATLHDVLYRGLEAEDIRVRTKWGFHLIPGASGAAHMTSLPLDARQRLLKELASLEEWADVLVVDTGAGIHPGVRAFAAACGHTLILTTPEPTALTDCYATIKALLRHDPRLDLGVVINMTKSEREGRQVFDRLNRVCRTFLTHEVAYRGAIPEDEHVRRAVHAREPLLHCAPRSVASQAIERLAGRILSDPSHEEEPLTFVERLKRWLGKAPGMSHGEQTRAWS